jgi:hypothetical protein
MKYNIKQLINKEALDKQIDINQDGYGGACVNVAINVMEHLDDFNQEFNIGYHPDMTTPHGIICKCDDQGGITGFMAGAARNIVALCHEKGWKFWLADVISSYDIDDSDKIEKYITNLMTSDSLKLDEVVVRDYVNELIERYKEKESIKTEI